MKKYLKIWLGGRPYSLNSGCLVSDTDVRNKKKRSTEKPLKITSADFTKFEDATSCLVKEKLPSVLRETGSRGPDVCDFTVLSQTAFYPALREFPAGIGCI